VGSYLEFSCYLSGCPIKNGCSRRYSAHHCPVSVGLQSRAQSEAAILGRVGPSDSKYDSYPDHAFVVIKEEVCLQQPVILGFIPLVQETTDKVVSLEVHPSAG
jgi:hypothetical protein